MMGMSDKCGRESCRFNNTGKCTDPEDQIIMALSDQVIKD